MAKRSDPSAPREVPGRRPTARPTGLTAGRTRPRRRTHLVPTGGQQDHRSADRQLADQEGHVVLDGEIQVSHDKQHGVGTRIDITATAGGVRPARLVFEAKHADNSFLLKAIDDQLVQRYMDPYDVTHRIYIVYWVDPTQRPSKWSGKHPDQGGLAKLLREQARNHAPEHQIEVVVLDIDRPAFS